MKGVFVVYHESCWNLVLDEYYLSRSRLSRLDGPVLAYIIKPEIQVPRPG